MKALNYESYLKLVKMGGIFCVSAVSCMMEFISGQDSLLRFYIV